MSCRCFFDIPHETIIWVWTSARTNISIHGVSTCASDNDWHINTDNNKPIWTQPGHPSVGRHNECEQQTTCSCCRRRRRNTSYSSVWHITRLWQIKTYLRRLWNFREKNGEQWPNPQLGMRKRAHDWSADFRPGQPSVYTESERRVITNFKYDIWYNNKLNIHIHQCRDCALAPSQSSKESASSAALCKAL